MNATDKLKATTVERAIKTVEEQKTEKKFMFQFINHENGLRSEPFVGSWKNLNQVLELREEGERPVAKDYILLVAVLDKDDTIIPATPLITVESYLKNIKTGDSQ